VVVATVVVVIGVVVRVVVVVGVVWVPSPQEAIRSIAINIASTVDNDDITIFALLKYCFVITSIDLKFKYIECNSQ
jgi:hypothetical protein